MITFESCLFIHAVVDSVCSAPGGTSPPNAVRRRAILADESASCCCTFNHPLPCVVVRFLLTTTLAAAAPPTAPCRALSCNLLLTNTLTAAISTTAATPPHDTMPEDTVPGVDGDGCSAHEEQGGAKRQTSGRGHLVRHQEDLRHRREFQIRPIKYKKDMIKRLPCRLFQRLSNTDVAQRTRTGPIHIGAGSHQQEFHREGEKRCPQFSDWPIQEKGKFLRDFLICRKLVIVKRTGNF